MKLKHAGILAASISTLLAACAGGPLTADTTISGTASYLAPLANATITACDASGMKKTAKANANGAFTVDASGLTGPVLLAASNGAAVPMNGSISFAALLPALQKGNNLANVNALTDKIASDIATGDLKLKGSVQLIQACKPAGVTAESIKAKTDALRPLIVDAYQAAGVSEIDPVKSAPAAVLAQVYHNRDGFSDSKSDEWRGSKIYDRNLQEISNKNVKLDPKLKDWSSYKTRIFVAGDSTASNYGLDVAPRMGWGQVFDRMIKAGDVKVVNVAQSGRSSRSFVTEGWFKLIEDNIKPGDYLLVQFGHNDEKCAAKGAVDVKFRCTYPGALADTTAKGLPAEMSFQGSLERYVKMAKAKGATPVLITPTTRIVQDKSIKDYEEAKFPIEATTHKGHSTSAVNPGGDYSQTVRDTAKANNVALVDLDAKTIAFANSVGFGSGGAEAKDSWRDYWLGVSDFAKYPYYKDAKRTGNIKKADRTHFQEKGAVKVAEMVVEGLKAEQAKLGDLVKLLK